jgi:hypothetical protein
MRGKKIFEVYLMNESKVNIINLLVDEVFKMIGSIKTCQEGHHYAHD